MDPLEDGAGLGREAANISARTSGGASRSVQSRPAPETDQILHFYIPLGSGVFPGQTVTLEASYQLAQQPQRATTLSQANEALFMFPVWPLGDPGRSTVEVRIPSGYEIDVVGGPLEQQEQEDEVVLTADSIPDPETFWAMVLAMNESKLMKETTEVAGTKVDLHAWPGDTEWVTFVSDLITDGVSVFEDLSGQPWPEDQSLMVVETMAPLARGYGGWYDPVEQAIRIGNELDAHLVLHELSHVWFNHALFEERWVFEGFAEEYAYQAALELERSEVPGRPGPVPEQDRLVPLAEWADSQALVDETNRAVEEYGYATAWHVIGTLVDEVGLDEMRDVIQVAADRRVTYVGGPEHGQLTASMDWRRLLDLLENVAGSESAESVFRDYVVGPSERPELDERSAARDSYFDLVERGGEWAAPFEVRWYMAEWGFEEATSAMDHAREVLDLRDRIEQELDGLDVDPLGLQEEYEATSSVDRVLPVAEDTLDAAEAYRDAKARASRSRSLLEAVGLWWSGTGGRLEDARDGLEEGVPAASVEASESVVDRLDHGGRDGALRLGGVTFVAAGAALIPIGRRRLRRRRLDRDLQAFLEQAARPEHGGVG